MAGNTLANELTQLTATQAVAGLRQRKIGALELVDAAIERIEAVDGEINSLPIHNFEKARATAIRHDNAPGDDNPRSLLGLPIAVKDYNDVKGLLTTYGSPMFADNVAAESDPTVTRLQENGANVIAKSNVPEWAGGHTFNPLFGTTRNPWNTALSAGGSSGGSGAALAAGLVWLATGNDLGGSLRTPASFNGVVGLRPSPGVVPRPTRLLPFDVLWVEGPMGRCVSDVAMMLDAGCGEHPEDPLSFDPTGPLYQKSLNGPAPSRVAFSPDLGVVPMTRSVADMCLRATHQFASLGTEVTTDAPDFTGAVDGFQTLRALLIASMMGPLLDEHRERIAPEIIGNIERGLNLGVDEILKAERDRAELVRRMERFFDSHDCLVCPAASITPFPVEQRYVEEIDGQPCQTYIDWFSITFAITMTGCPSLSLPCGLSDDGLPIGMQLIGKPRGERALLRAAHQLEGLLGMSDKVPVVPSTVAGQ
ncbi:MAG: amidase [Chromatiales bacterium]|jgi:amidase|nr:amidase [Chromatiales bacterium]